MSNLIITAADLIFILFSGAVISAPPSKSRDDEDVLATLQKYENETQAQKKTQQLTALAKDIAHAKKAKMMAESVKKSQQTSVTTSSTSKAPTSVSISDETLKKAKLKKRIVRTGGG